MGFCMTDAERTQARLDAYYAAETAILANQAFTIDGSVFTKANLADVQRQINRLRNELASMQSGGSIRQTQVVF